jgi:hypothetical protein
MHRTEPSLCCSCVLQLKELDRKHGSRWVEVPPVLVTLKARAKALDLWNLFMPPGKQGSRGVPMVEYAALSEVS